MESTPEQAAEGRALVTVLACVLEKLIQANAYSGHDRLEAEAVTKFHALRPPGIGVAEYLDRILKYSSCSNECFVLGLIYMDRFIQRNDFALTALNVHRVAITSVMVAAKFFDDQYYNNAYYAKVGGVPCGEINSLEIEFLFGLDFNLAVTAEEYRNYRERLGEHANCSACGCSGMVMKMQQSMPPRLQDAIGRDGRGSSSPSLVPPGYASGWPKPREASADIPPGMKGCHPVGNKMGNGSTSVTPAAMQGTAQEDLSSQRQQIAPGALSVGDGVGALVGLGLAREGSVSQATSRFDVPNGRAALERQVHRQQHEAQQQLQQEQMLQARLLQQQQQQQQQQLQRHQQRQQLQQMMVDSAVDGSDSVMHMAHLDGAFYAENRGHQSQHSLRQHQQQTQQQFYYTQQQQQQQHQRPNSNAGGPLSGKCMPGGVSMPSEAGNGSGGHGHNPSVNGGRYAGAGPRFRITPSPERVHPLPTTSSGAMNVTIAGGGGVANGGVNGVLGDSTSAAFGTVTVQQRLAAVGTGVSSAEGCRSLVGGHVRRSSTGGSIRGMGGVELGAVAGALGGQVSAGAGDGFIPLGSTRPATNKLHPTGYRGGRDRAMASPHGISGDEGNGGGRGWHMDPYDEGSSAVAGQNSGGADSVAALLLGKQQQHLRRQQQLQIQRHRQGQQHHLKHQRQQQEQQQQQQQHHQHVRQPMPQPKFGHRATTMQGVRVGAASARSISSSPGAPQQGGPYSGSGLAACSVGGTNGYASSPSGYPSSDCGASRSGTSRSVVDSDGMMTAETLVDGPYFGEDAVAGCNGVAPSNGLGQSKVHYNPQRGHTRGEAPIQIRRGHNHDHGFRQGHRPRNSSASCDSFATVTNDLGLGVLVGNPSAVLDKSPLSEFAAAVESRKHDREGMYVTTPPRACGDSGSGYYASALPDAPTGSGVADVNGDMVGTGARMAGADVYSPEGKHGFYTPQRRRSESGTFGVHPLEAAALAAGGVGNDGSVYVTPRSTPRHVEGEDVMRADREGASYSHQCLDPSISYATSQDLGKDFEGFDMAVDRRQIAHAGFRGAAQAVGTQGSGAGWPLDAARETWSY